MISAATTRLVLLPVTATAATSWPPVQDDPQELPAERLHHGRLMHQFAVQPRGRDADGGSRRWGR